MDICLAFRLYQATYAARIQNGEFERNVIGHFFKLKKKRFNSNSITNQIFSNNFFYLYFEK